jgi:hypothetical protein
MANKSAPHVTGSLPKEKEGVASSTTSGISASLPVEKLAAATARGTKVVYAALGTMALKDRWAQDIGSSSNGNVPVGIIGKAFCQHVWKSLFAAMSDLGDHYHCVVCVGTQDDALDFLEGDTEECQLSKVPQNVTVCSFVQQMEMLSNYADVFISHAGFNSLQESLIAGVPLIAVPQAIDQPANARKIEASGWGRAFLQPMSSISASTLAEAVRDVTAEHTSYRKTVASTSSELRDGEVRAADRLFEMVLDQARPAEKLSCSTF